MAPADVPLRLARRHRDLPEGAQTEIIVATRWPRAGLELLLDGAGFRIDRVIAERRSRRLIVTRLRTLPDLLRPGLRLVVCGLNPSLYAADAGVPFARPGNRFWPAALQAGLVTSDRDPWSAAEVDGIGWTDLVKRPSPGAAELTREEYVAGCTRLAWSIRLVAPHAVCFVGLSGWRAAVDRRAVAGVQPGGFAGAPAYVMPNTSGLNGRTRPAQFVAHFEAALALADSRGPGALSARSRPPTA